MKQKWLILIVGIFFIFLEALAQAGGDKELTGILFKDNFDNAVSDQWQLMRMQFIVRDGRLQVVSAPRPGFNYGHTKNGRAAAAFIHIGDKTWEDYKVEMDVFSGAVGEFNPHVISYCMRGSFSIFFRVEDYQENWNKPGLSAYAVNVNPIPKLCDGNGMVESTLTRINNWYAAANSGWCGGIAKNYFIPENGLSKVVTDNVDALWNELINKKYLDSKGRILSRIISIQDDRKMGLDEQYQSDQKVIYEILIRNYCYTPGGSKDLRTIDGGLWNIDRPNHVVIEAVGRTISMTVNGIKALDFEDLDSDALLYGGVGIQWGWENTGWIDNVVITKL